jgi:Na+-transporting NADH:ubiquinone oxidoreductase subunit NqrD
MILSFLVLVNKILNCLPFNGHKLDVGLVTFLTSMFIKQYFNIDHDQAESIVTGIIQGIGYSITLIGFIHQKIKSRLATAGK